MIESGIPKRFKKILQELNLNAARFSKMTGISESVISSWKNKGFKPSSESIQMMKTTFPEINIDYLLSEIGEPLLTTQNLCKEPDVLYEQKDIEKYINSLEEEIRVLRNKIEEKRIMLTILRKSII